MNKGQRVVFTLALFSLTSVFGFLSLASAEYGAADTDGFQRPKEKKQTTAEEETKSVPSSKTKNTNTDGLNDPLDASQDGFKRPKEQKKIISKEAAEERQKAQEASDALFYENLDGFKRPKKSN